MISKPSRGPCRTSARHTRGRWARRWRRARVKVVLGPGTGLGVAALLPADGRWHVIASEGGHVSFGPQARDETAMFAKLSEECGAISAETVLSGPGLVRLARALDPPAGRHQPETIVASALAREP